MDAATHPKTQGQLARDIMAKRLQMVRPEADVADAVARLIKHEISGMPVVGDGGRYLGVFSEKSCMKVLQQTAELVGDPSLGNPHASDVMVSKLHKLSPEQDVFDAITSLLKQRVSGAPVENGNGEFVGVFSEQTSMRVLLDVAYDQIPTGEVGSFMNTDRGRLIAPDVELLDIAKIFVETPYRRLPVVEGDRIIGQISRRDVLRASRILDTIVRYGLEQAGANPGDDSMIMLKAARDLPSTEVAGFMDDDAATIDEETDLLTIAQTFLKTPYRRLPVLKDGIVVGQVSRRDVLSAVHHLLQKSDDRGKFLLYLSASRPINEPPVA